MYKFEDKYEEICVLIEKKRNKWQFKASVMKDFDDVKMEILARIFNWWDSYDQERPLGAWVNRVIHNAVINILRDSYLSTSSPCNRCACNIGDGLCSLYGQQGEECGLFKEWYDNKRYRHEARLPLALEDHLNDVHEKPDRNINFEKCAKSLHAKIKPLMTASEWEIYEKIFIENKDKEEAAKELGFKTSEKNRVSGYKRIKQVEKKAYEMAKQILIAEGIDELL